MLQSKFIIELDEEGVPNLIMSKCVFHKDLVIEKKNVRGGGMFRFDDGVFTFYGESQDFGTAKTEDIKTAIESDKVFTNPFIERSIAKKFKFVYTQYGETIKLN